MADVNIKVTADTASAVSGLKNVDRALSDLEGGAKTAQGGLGGLNGVVGNLAAQLGPSALAGALGAAAVASVKLAASAEQTQIAFTNLLGSGEEATTFLNELRDFAAATPFEFNDLTTAARRMMAFGFAAEDVIPMLTNIGDAVAAMGGSADMVDRVTLAIGQMSAKGKVSAGEMLQLTEAGIPAWRYLAEAIGVSTAEVQKMSEKGLIPAEKAIAAINAGMQKDFGGMMAAQSKTANGQLSNLNDTLAQTGTIIGNLFLPTVGRVIPVLSDTAKMVGDSVTAFGQLNVMYNLAQISALQFVGAIDAEQAALRNQAVVAGDAYAGLLGVDEAAANAEKSQAALAKATAVHNAEAERWTGLAGAYIAATNDANTALGNGQSAVDALSVGMQKYTDLLLFNAASAGLPAEAALRLGVAMGVVDTASILAADGVEALRKKYDENGDGAVDAGQNTYDYLKAVEALQSGIAALPDQKTIRIDIQTNGQMPSIPGTGGSPTTPIPLANGGDFMVNKPTHLLVGEAGPERVQVTPAGGASSNVTNNYNLSIQTTTPVSVPHEFAQARAFAGGY